MAPAVAPRQGSVADLLGGKMTPHDLEPLTFARLSDFKLGIVQVSEPAPAQWA
jgi:hypothetical protein